MHFENNSSWSAGVSGGAVRLYLWADNSSPRAQETGGKTTSSSQRMPSHAAISPCHSNMRLNNSGAIPGDSGPLSPTFVASITGWLTVSAVFSAWKRWRKKQTFKIILIRQRILKPSGQTGELHVSSKAPTYATPQVFQLFSEFLWKRTKVSGVRRAMCCPWHTGC